MKIAEAFVEVKVSEKPYLNQLSKLQTATKRSVDRMQKNFNRIGKGISDISRVARYGFVGMVAAIAGVTYAAQKQEKAVAKLVQQLKNHNEYTSENINALTDQASALQKLTQFGDEQIIAGQAMLASFSLTTQQIKDLTPHMLNLAVMTENTTGQQADLASVAKLVGVALSGQAGRLVQMGIKLSDAQKEMLKLADEHEKINVLMQIFEANAGGLAEATGKTLAGSLSKVKNIMGDLAEEIGFVLSPVIVNASKLIVKKVSKWIEAIKALTPEHKKLIAQVVFLGTAVLAMIGSLSLFGSVAKLIMSAGSIIVGTLGLILSPIGLLMAGITALVAVWALGWDKIKEITSKLVEIVVMPTIKFVGEKIENLADWIQEKLGIPEEARKGVWELTAITTTIPFIVELIWKGIKNVSGTVKEWVIKQAKLDKPIESLVAKVADFFIELPDPTKWSFKIGFRLFEYGTLGYGIFIAARSLITAVKIPAISGGILPLLFTIGIAILGLDILGAKIKEKLEEAKIEELLTKFSEKHPTLFKLSVAIKELTGLEADIVLAYIDAEWPSIQDKVGLALFQIQIPLKVIYDIDIRTWWAGFWEDFKEGFKVTWIDPWEDFRTALKEAWDNTDWDWFKQGLKMAGEILVSIAEGFKAIGVDIWDILVTVWTKGIGPAVEKIKNKVSEAFERISKIDVDWKIWGDKADAQTREAIDNISNLRKTVEAEIGEKIPKEFDALITALVASESAFDTSATNMGGAAVGLGQMTRGALEDVNKSLEKSGSKWKFTLEDMQDPVKNLQAMIIYFGIVSKRNDHDLMKSIMYWKGWGKEIGEAGGELKKLPPEAQKQFKAFLKICKDFGIDAYDLLTSAMKKAVGGSGGAVGALEEGTKKIKGELDKWLGSMDALTKKMMVIFQPIIGMFEKLFEGITDMMIKSENEAISQMGKDIKGFVDDVLGMMRGLFAGIEDEVADNTSWWKAKWEKHNQAIIDKMKGTSGILQRIWAGLGEYWRQLLNKSTGAWVDFVSSLVDYAADIVNALADVISGTKSLGEAIKELAYSIPVVGGLIQAFVNLGKAIWGWLTGTADEARKIEDALEDICDTTDDLALAMKEVGISLSGSIAEAELAIKGLIESQAELEMSTRDKLIKELDNYYDYRVLREMDLTQLLELSAKTREELEKGSLEVVAESAEEAAEREKDAKVSTLQAIEDAYKKESELIEKKLALLQIEIKLLMAAALAEQGKLKESEKLLKEANAELLNLLYTEEELEKKLWETQKEIRRWGKEWDEAGQKGQQAIKDTGTAVSKVTAEMTEDMRNAINAMTEKMDELPKLIDFDIIGHLYMPDIPQVGDQHFTVWGHYRGPSIPTAQVGIPYIPRTMPVIVHPKEAILTPPQAEEWRKGGTEAGARVVEQNITIQSLFPPDDPVLWDRIWREGLRAAAERESGRRTE